MPQEYNGHPSYDHWNVSLWVCNDEPLYRAAVDHTKEFFVELLREYFPRTPDGVTVTPILAAYAWEDANEK